MKRRQELPIVSGILVAANVIVYLICTFTGNLLYNIGELDAAAGYVLSLFLSLHPGKTVLPCY